jgi:hypothetical protein
LTRLALGLLVIGATVGTALLIRAAPSAVPPPRAPQPGVPLPTALGTSAVQAADTGTTTITREVTPVSPADPTSTESLTATISPSTATGVLQFNDGSTSLGDLVTLTNGTAATTTIVTAGDHALTAELSPTHPAVLIPSTSDPVSLTK